MLVELVNNGDFSDTEHWDAGNGWSISNGAANFSQVANRGKLEQTLEIAVGKTYLVTFDVLFSSVAGATVSVGGTSASVSGTGRKTYSLTAVNTTGISFWPGNLEDSSWKLDNVSVLYEKDFSLTPAHKNLSAMGKEITQIVDTSEYQR